MATAPPRGSFHQTQAALLGLFHTAAATAAAASLPASLTSRFCFYSFFSLFFFFFFFFSTAAQRKGEDEVPPTTERPDRTGLPQTETGERDRQVSSHWFKYCVLIGSLFVWTFLNVNVVFCFVFCFGFNSRSNL